MLWFALCIFLAVLSLGQAVAVARSGPRSAVALEAALHRLRSGALPARKAPDTVRSETTPVRAFVERMIQRLLPYGGRVVSEEAEQRLVWAGLSMDVERWGAIRLLCLGAGGIAGFVLLGPMTGSLSGAVAMAGLGALAGWIGTEQWLNARVKHRHQLISRELPIFVDFLATTCGADLPLDEALDRVREEFPGHLSRTFAATERAQMAGETLDGALQWVAEQVGHSDLTAVVQQILRAREYGTPLADELFEVSRYLDDLERERSKERSQRMGVMLLFPMVMFIVPSIFLILGYPALVSLMRGLMSAL